MEYVNLEDITEEHLHGTWRVESRLINKSDPNHIFVIYNCIEFLKDDSFIARNGKDIKGRWEIIREHEMIYNPQVKFYINNKYEANSIITNLMTDMIVYKLILYFDSGLELILKKDIQNEQCI